MAANPGNYKVMCSAANAFNNKLPQRKDGKEKGNQDDTEIQHSS